VQSCCSAVSPTTTRTCCAAPRANARQNELLWGDIAAIERADQRANVLLLDAAALAAIDTDDERRG
jgi:hypothetical protein